MFIFWEYTNKGFKVAEYAYNPITGNLDRVGSGGGTPVTYPLDVSLGGTGQDSWPAHAIPIGDGTDIIKFRSPTDVSGAVLQSLGEGFDPAYSNTSYPMVSVSGDMIYALANNEFSQLGIGTEGQLLAVISGFPSWQDKAPDANIWTNVVGATQAMAINSGYLANNAALVTLTLPATAAQFSTIKVVGVGAGGWKIAQNANQKIIWLGDSSTVGVTGFMSSVDANSCVTLRCVVGGTSTFWVVEQSEGNITIS